MTLTGDSRRTDSTILLDKKLFQLADIGVFHPLHNDYLPREIRLLFIMLLGCLVAAPQRFAMYHLDGIPFTGFTANSLHNCGK